MSENEINPVDGAIPAREFEGQLWIQAGVVIELRSKDRVAIDRLTEERDNYHEHLGDVVSRLQRAEAERDALRADTERLEFILRRTTGDALRYAVGELADTSDIDEFRSAIDAARAKEMQG